MRRRTPPSCLKKTLDEEKAADEKLTELALGGLNQEAEGEGEEDAEKEDEDEEKPKRASARKK